MTLAEFKNIIDTFGTQPEDWPEDAKKPLQALLESSAEAQLVFAEQTELERMLGQLQAPMFSELEQKILNQSLPPRQSWLDKLVAWIIPDSFSLQLWRPALVACFPLVVGIVVGNYFSFGVSDQELALEYWDDELTLLSFNDFSSGSAGTELEL